MYDSSHWISVSCVSIRQCSAAKRSYSVAILQRKGVWGAAWSQYVEKYLQCRRKIFLSREWFRQNKTFQRTSLILLFREHNPWMTTRGFWFNAWELNEWAEVDFFYFFYFQGADLFIRWHLKIRNMSVRFTEPCPRLWRLYRLNFFSSYRWLRTSPTRCRKPGFQQRTLSNAAQMRLITVFSGKPRLLSPLCTRPSVRK